MDAQTVNATTQAATATAWIPIIVGILGFLMVVVQFITMLYTRSMSGLKGEVKEMRVELNDRIDAVHSRLNDQFVTQKECDKRHESYREGFANGSKTRVSGGA